MKHKPIPLDIGEYLKVDLKIPHGLRWIKLTPNNYRVKVDDPAGSKLSCGKYNLYFKNVKYYNHRIIFYLQNGIDPDQYHVDHKDHNNNAGVLRLSTHQQNHFNRRSCKNSSSIYKGVSWHKKDKRWEARIGFRSEGTRLNSSHVSESRMPSSA